MDDKTDDDEVVVLQKASYYKPFKIKCIIEKQAFHPRVPLFSGRFLHLVPLVQDDKNDRDVVARVSIVDGVISQSFAALLGVASFF